MLKENDTFINVSILTQLTGKVTITDINKELEGHTVSQDDTGTINKIDGRTILYYSGKYFFMDGFNLDGTPNPMCIIYLRLLGNSQ